MCPISWQLIVWCFYWLSHKDSQYLTIISHQLIMTLSGYKSNCLTVPH